MSNQEQLQLFEGLKIRTVMKGDDGKNREQMTADIEGILRIVYLFAADARKDFEKRIGHSIISPDKAIDHTVPAELLPFNESKERSDFFEE